MDAFNDGVMQRSIERESLLEKVEAMDQRDKAEMVPPFHLLLPPLRREKKWGNEEMVPHDEGYGEERNW